MNQSWGCCSKHVKLLKINRRLVLDFVCAVLDIYDKENCNAEVMIIIYDYFFIKCAFFKCFTLCKTVYVLTCVKCD